MGNPLLPIAVNSRMGLFATPEKRFGVAQGQLGEAAGSTWKIGAPLVFSSGYLAEAGTNPTGVVGFATAAATGITGADVMYVPAYTPTLEFEISIDKASGQGGASAKLANTNVGTVYGITKDATTGFWYLDVDKNAETTYFGFRLMGFKENANTNSSDVGVINGRAIGIAITTASVTAAGTIYI